MNDEPKKESGNGKGQGTFREQTLQRFSAIESQLQTYSEEREIASKAGQDFRSATSEIQTLKTSIQSDVEFIRTSKGEIQSIAQTLNQLNATSEQNAASISSLTEKAKANSDLTGKLANKAAQIETSLGTYEKKLDSLAEKMDARFLELTEKIEGLLPGATSAGLASSFDIRKRSFKPTIRLWGITFTISIIGLIYIFLFEVDWLPSIGTVSDLESLTVNLLKRFALAFPFIWFALFSSRQYRAAKRLEEDYAYKEVLSRAFEGYKKELEEIKPNPLVTAKEPSLLHSFCGNVLEKLALRPGRIYEEIQKEVNIFKLPRETKKEIEGSE